MSTRRFVVGLGVAFVAGCGGERPDVSSRAAADSRATGASSTDNATEGWRVVAWEPYAGVDPSDLGVGVVFLRRAEDKAGTPGTDTLLLRSAPNASAVPVGAVLFTVSGNGVTSYAIASADSIRPNLVEYGYEESGAPFDSSDATGRWVRAILGFAADGGPRIGWVDTSRPGVGTIRWTEQLADRPLFFPKPEAAAFFATPDSGTPVARPRGGDDEYAMHPEEVRGSWMRVRLVVPSDNCVDPDSVARQTRRAWIRYLDDRGRPNVWYYTRGC
jgi:hypothetical protein